MKKIIGVFLAFTIILTLSAGCSKESTADKKANAPAQTETSATPPADENQENSTTAGSDNTPQSSKPSVTVTVPDGWDKVDSAALAQYQKGAAGLIITCDIMPVSGADEYVKYAEEQYKKTFSDASFTEAKKITVDGKEGRDYGFTITTSGMKLKFRVVYVFKDSQAFTLTCSAPEEGFDQATSEFQGIIDSFKIP